MATEYSRKSNFNFGGKFKSRSSLFYHLCSNNIKIRQSLIYSSLVAWTTVQMNRRTSVWCSKHYFFHHLLQNTLQKAFQFILSFFHKITKIKLKSFEYSKSIKSLKKNNAWNIRRLVDDSFVSSSQLPSVNISEIDGF